MHKYLPERLAAFVLHVGVGRLELFPIRFWGARGLELLAIKCCTSRHVRSGLPKKCIAKGTPTMACCEI